MRTPRNQFYNEFDCESVEPRETDPHRSPFQIDRDRIIYSSAFRRLQSKTQVFVSGEFDFYRTRLTHSLEVAQIGRSICSFLNQTSSFLAADFCIDPDLVEAVCLAHDLGHSPFGHAGERALHQLMRNFGGFEGNAQSLRLIGETIYSGTHGRRGMNATRALIDGIQKYKRLFREDRAADNHFLYDDQESLRGFTVGPAISEPGLDYSRLRSLECQIMDWADDTAYGLSDIVDSINAGFLRFERVEDWAANQSLKPDEQKHIETVLSAIKERKVEARFSRKIGALIRATSLLTRTGPLSEVSHRYRLSLVVEPEVRAEVDIYKRLCRDLVFRHSQLHQLERKARMILDAIFTAFAEAYLEAKNPPLRLLPESYDSLVRNANGHLGRARMLCDYVAGMTDLFATRTYKRLFDPSFGSTLDL
ncbi:MAG TPA: dNTP triphosphohydrolase [Chthoniobacterales bacterium]|nr:dNTP triphosphohydrolase [Chthoniobacterales bacterium]